MSYRLKVVAFDIIETVFSLETMRPRLMSLGLPASALELWIASALRDAFAVTITDRFAPFRPILRGALATLLSTHGLPVEEKNIAAVLDGMAELDPHPDAAAAFALLAKNNLRIVALSNGATSVTESLLRRSSLDQYVEAIYSIEQVQQFKPCRDVYLHAANACGVDRTEVALVATHAWDIHGASAANLMTGFVVRGQSYPSVMLKPDVEGQTLLEVAQALIALSSDGKC
jgi:2-haloacid dehalogenase